MQSPAAQRPRDEPPGQPMLVSRKRSRPGQPGQSQTQYPLAPPGRAGVRSACTVPQAHVGRCPGALPGLQRVVRRLMCSNVGKMQRIGHPDRSSGAQDSQAFTRQNAAARHVRHGPMCSRWIIGGDSPRLFPSVQRGCPPFPGSYTSPPIPRSSSSFFRLKPTTNSPSTSVAGVEKTSSFSRSANADSSSPMLRSMNGISC